MKQDLFDALQDALDANSQLPCAAGFRVAEQVGATPAQVGQMANELDIRLTRCQLGLFGYGSKAEGTHRIVKAMQDIPPKLEAAIRQAWNGPGITCGQAWEIADEIGVSKRDVADACEALGVRITVCQLGAFPRPKK